LQQRRNTTVETEVFEPSANEVALELPPYLRGRRALIALFAQSSMDNRRSAVPDGHAREAFPLANIESSDRSSAGVAEGDQLQQRASNAVLALERTHCVNS